MWPGKWKKARNQITERLKRHEVTLFLWIKNSKVCWRRRKYRWWVSAYLVYWHKESLDEDPDGEEGTEKSRGRRGEKDGLWWWMMSFSLFYLQFLPWSTKGILSGEEMMFVLSENSLLFQQKNQLINSGCHWDMGVHWKEHQPNKSLRFG